MQGALGDAPKLAQPPGAKQISKHHHSMPNTRPIGRSEKFSISLQRRWMLIPLALRLLCMAIALQALGMQQLIAADAALNEPARSVVLIDSALTSSIPKEELADSQVIPIDGNGNVVAQITQALGTLKKIDVLRVISHGSDGKLKELP